MKEKIEKLKIELFDIIRQQDLLRLEFGSLDKLKQQKLAELQKLEKDVDTIN